MNDLIQAGFIIQSVHESYPSKDMLHIPGMEDEYRRPMFLMIAAKNILASTK